MWSQKSARCFSAHTKFLWFNLRDDPAIGSKSHSADTELKVEPGSLGELVLRRMLDFRVSTQCVSNCCASMWGYSLNREIRRKERHLQGSCCAFTTEAVSFFGWRVLCLPQLTPRTFTLFPQVFLILMQFCMNPCKITDGAWYFVFFSKINSKANCFSKF